MRVSIQVQWHAKLFRYLLKGQKKAQHPCSRILLSAALWYSLGERLDAVICGKRARMPFKLSIWAPRVGRALSDELELDNGDRISEHGVCSATGSYLEEPMNFSSKWPFSRSRY